MFEKKSKSHIQRPHYKRGNLALGHLQKAVRRHIVTERRLYMAGHILRFPDHRAAKVAISWTLADAGVKQDAPRRRGAELSSRICRWSTSSGRRLNTLQLTVQNGAKLLPDVPKGTGRTKSRSEVPTRPRCHG